MLVKSTEYKQLDSIDIKKCRSKKDTIKRERQADMKRTTCFINAEQYRQLKHVATDRGMTVTDLINEGVKSVLWRYARQPSANNE